MTVAHRGGSAPAGGPATRIPIATWIATAEEVRTPTFVQHAAVSNIPCTVQVASGSSVFRHRRKVTEVVPAEMLTYLWRYDDYPGSATSEWKLVKTPSGTRLVLTGSGLASFPQEVPEFRRESCHAGWECLLRRRLPAFLEDT